MSGIEHIKILLSSDDFREILSYDEKPNVMDILGVSYDERRHTKLLSYLFSSGESHGLGSKFFNDFLLDAAAMTSAAPPLPIEFAVGFMEMNYRVTREYGSSDGGFIDILIDSPAASMILGIEVKVYAAEGRNQVSRYQEMIKRNFSHYRNKAIIFLTPDGRPSLTSNVNASVRCYSASFSVVSSALSRSEGRWVSQIGALIDSYKRTIDNMTGADKDLTALVHKLWLNPTYQKAIDLLLMHRPRLADWKLEYEDAMRRIAKKELNSEVEFQYYRPRDVGEILEIKARFSELDCRGLPLTLMFYWYFTAAGEQPAVRLLVDGSSYHANITSLKKFASDHPGIIASQFPTVADWTYWRRVFAEDDYPDDAVVNPGDNLGLRAAEKAKEIIVTILPLIKKSFPK